MRRGAGSQRAARLWTLHRDLRCGSPLKIEVHVKRAQGVTMLELMVVAALMGVMALTAFPAMESYFENQRLKDGAMSLSAAVNYARSEAILTGNNHIVFYQTDALGATLNDAASNPVPILVLDDGRPGDANQNCRIDAGEPIRAVRFEEGVGPGITGSPGPAPADLGAGDHTTGASFSDPGGNDASWVMFLPQGQPVSFDSSCNMGDLGSGAGGFYLTNGERTAAVVVMPTGGSRLNSFAQGWSD
jgi:prepilin-type N-terminal cleavage/methylation domain-containing protein